MVLVFRCYLLVSATSSYVDDIAFIKILCGQGLMWHPQLQGRVVHYFVLSLGGFDFLLLLTGISSLLGPSF